MATTFLTRLTTQATRCRLLQPITRRRLAAITAVLGQLTTQIRILLRHARQRGDPAQSRGEELFKSSNLVHSTTDSEKSSQRHEIQTATENSCAQWPRRLTSKLTKKPVGGWGAWELRFVKECLALSFNCRVYFALGTGRGPPPCHTYIYTAKNTDQVFKRECLRLIV